VGANRCKSARSGCKLVQVIQGQVHVIDDLVQVGASNPGMGAGHPESGASQ
jgi:hypothetical protein